LLHRVLKAAIYAGFAFVDVEREQTNHDGKRRTAVHDAAGRYIFSELDLKNHEKAMLANVPYAAAPNSGAEPTATSIIALSGLGADDDNSCIGTENTVSVADPITHSYGSRTL